MKYRDQLAAWTASLAEAHAQDLRWHQYDRVLEMALGRASRVEIPGFDRQLAMWQGSMANTNADDANWFTGGDPHLQRMDDHRLFFEADAKYWREKWRVAILAPCVKCGVAASEFCLDMSYDGRKRGRKTHWPHTGRFKAGEAARWQSEPDEDEWEEPEPIEEDEPVIEFGSDEFEKFSESIEERREERKKAWEWKKNRRKS